MSAESRERVLENIKQLMEVTDWSYFDPNKVIHLESKNPQAFLEKLLNDYEKLQRKKAAELVEEQEEQRKLFEDEYDSMETRNPPMTSNAFRTSMNDQLKFKVITRSIEKSSKVASEFMEKTF